MKRPSMIQITRDAIRNDPKEIFNWWVLFCTWVWSFSGVAKGFDEGVLQFSPLFLWHTADAGQEILLQRW